MRRRKKPVSPKNASQGVVYKPDGREIASQAVYRARTAEMAARQGFKCAICTRIMNPPQFDHAEGRGSGGSRRDDRIVRDGEWFNAAVCERCNMEKGSRRYEWRDGVYQPKGG